MRMRNNGDIFGGDCQQPSSMAYLVRAAPRLISRVACSTSKRTIYNKVVFVLLYLLMSGYSCDCFSVSLSVLWCHLRVTLITKSV